MLVMRVTENNTGPKVAEPDAAGRPAA